ncbi:MAG TPA: DCC1-like thiol-disulfide oxidoreductase family protein [Dysgonamonadaceae bacterium]|nr:DCC1-like thiol-disulfide oxidoreductase family protein [Dysgonamonadaceae bacterium]
MKSIVFYDDLCGVCNYWVNWILKNDKRGVFYFASLQSDFEHRFSIHFNYAFPAETIVVWEEDTGLLIKSDALIFIFETIDPSSFRAKLLRLFPKFTRDIGYNIFAYFRRYKRLKSCKILSKEERKYFLTDNSVQDFLNL